MADYNTTASVVLTVNGQQAKQMLSDLQKKSEELGKKIKAATDSGDTKALKKYQTELRNVNRMMDQIKNSGQKVDAVLQRLDKATPKELNKALVELKRQLNGIERGSEAWNKHVAKIKQVKAQIAELNAEMKVQQTWTQRLASKFNEFGASIMAAAAGLTGLILAGKKAVSEFAQMDEAMANTQKFTGMTAEQVRDLNEEFKKMDTRTTRDKLNELAQEAGRLGKTSKEDIMGYVQAADILNVALSDLGDGATQKIAKLSNIFGVEETEGTYNAMVKIGSVINVLSQNSTASKPYLVEFTNRLAGVGNQANLTIQQIVGLGAVLDANAQKVEASSTAISQVLTRMFVDSAKYARVAGLDVEKFSNLLKTDANEALLQFLEALNKAGNMDVLAPMFKDMGESGARAIAAMSTLAKHIDEVRWQQQNANVAFEEGTSVLHEYEIFNNTAQASIDKARKRIQELSIQLGEKLMPIMSHVMSSGTFTLKLLNQLVDFAKNYGVQIGYLTSIILSYIAATKVANNWTLIWSKTVQFFTSDIKKAGAAVKAFFITLKSNPIGLIVSAVTALAGALILMNDKARQARKELESFKKEIRDIDKTSAEYSSQEIERLDRLYKVATDEKKSRDARLDAVKDLQKQYPSYFGDLEKEAILAGNAKDKYDELRDSIINTAKARAAQEKIADNSRQLLELELRRNTLDKEIEDLNNRRYKAQADFYNSQDMGSPSGYNAHYSGSALQEIDKGIKERKNELSQNVSLTEALTNANNELYDSYVKTNKVSPNRGTEDDGGNSGDGDYSPTMSDKERKAALKKAQQAFKEGLKTIKAEEEKELNELYAKRATGQIDYLQYIEERKSIEAKFYDDSLKFYEDNLKAIKGYNVEDDKDYQSLQLKKTETLQKYENQRISYSAERIKRQSQFEIQELQHEYKWKENKTVADEIALQEQILEIKVKYLQQQQDLYARGTKEWEDLQLQIEKVVEDDRLNHELKIQEAVAEMRKIYGEKTVKEQYEIHKKVLSYLKEQGKITIEEFDKMMEQLDKKLKADSTKEKSSLPGSDYSRSPFEIAKDRKQAFEKDKAELDKALKAGIISLEEYGRMLDQLERKYKKDMLDPLKQCGDTWVAMLSNMYDAWDDFFRSIKNGDWIGSLSSALQTTVSMMSAISSQLTQFTQAELEIQTSAIEKRYDKEIERAEGNNYKIKKLEKQKEDEIAKLKDEASKKNYEMQVIGAIAQTAANAISAYGAGLQVGGLAGLILAPIAAGIATASGLVQVALIKKQQQAAQAQGYSEGGFTPKGPKDKEVGIVHAGEWVASQKLVNNPSTRPMIEALDYAQRTNTIGSISSRDVSRSITGPMVLAHGGASSQPNVIVNVPENSSSNEDLNNTLDKLNQRLEEPFVTINTVSGDYGIDQAQAKYNRLLNNKSPKSKKPKSNK